MNLDRREPGRNDNASDNKGRLDSSSRLGSMAMAAWQEGNHLGVES